MGKVSDPPDIGSREPGVDIRFEGELYARLTVLTDNLRDAHTPEQAAAVAIELLYRALHREIQIGQGKSAQIFDLWEE